MVVAVVDDREKEEDQDDAFVEGGMDILDKESA